MRGSLSEGLARITLDGQRSTVLAIDRQLGISANGYTLARISKQTGEFYSAAGRRLGYVSREGLLVEYMTGGGARPIGAVRGLIRGSSAPVFADAASGRVIANLPTSGIVRITRFAQGGYWVELENGVRGWLPGAAVLLIAVLGTDQKLAVCGAQPGAIVTKSNRLVEYERCKRTASGSDLLAQGQVLHVPADAVSEIWEGGVRSGASSSFRMAALHSLRVDGLIYPAHAEYRLFPQGDPRDRGVRAPNMMEAPE